MLTYLRYALATTCFALSVACLGLWGWSYSHEGQRLDATSGTFGLRALDGLGIVAVKNRPKLSAVGENWRISAKPGKHVRWRISGTAHKPRNAPFLYYPANVVRQGWFGLDENSMYFPLWYPALVFALAAVGILRLGGRFTLRSALIATTVVAGLLGMVVAL